MRKAMNSIFERIIFQDVDNKIRSSRKVKKTISLLK